MDKKTYVLIHNHRFGSGIHFFKSKDYKVGFYNGENNNINEIQNIIDKLKLDVEFDRMEESIDIFDVNMDNIVDVDE